MTHRPSVSIYFQLERQGGELVNNIMLALTQLTGSRALRTGSMTFEATLWQNLDQVYEK